MTEKTYPLDIAADMLGCQQKKILTEWAKGTISVVIDFGDEIDDAVASIAINLSTQPRSEEFFNRFPGEHLDLGVSLGLSERRPTPAERKRNSELLDESHRELLLQQGLSGLNIPHRMRDDATYRHKDSDSDILETSAHIFGLWRVDYSDFSRQQVQKHFSITPYPQNSASNGIEGTYTPVHKDDNYQLIKKNLRITESDIAAMRKLLANRPGHQQAQSIPEELPGQPKSHGGIERFALEREKILAAALYVAHHFPKEVGKSFKSHAEAIAKHGYIFWQNEPAPDAGRMAKMLSDAARPPSEWKILGGNAKTK